MSHVVAIQPKTDQMSITSVDTFAEPLELQITAPLTIDIVKPNGGSS